MVRDDKPNERWADQLVRYALAAGLAVGALLLQFGAESIFRTRLLGWTFYPAVIAAGLLLGAGPGILCALLCTVALWVFMLYPPGVVPDPADAPTLLVFAAITITMALLASAYRASTVKVRAALDEAHASAQRAEQERLLTAQAREELARHRDSLEQLVRTRTDELEASQEQLRLSERLAALGTLSAGLGHDLGNLLLPIRARLDVLAARDLPPEARDDVEAIDQCAEYLQALARGLRMFARDPKSPGAGDTTDLADWAADAAPFLRIALSHNITLDLRIPDDLPPVSIAPSALTQAVVSLVTNAREAVGAERPARIVIAAEQKDPATVRLSVADDGPGMSEGVRRRAVEPFFTTKIRGAATGTGLGLTLVHGALEAAGGSLHMTSALGRGTTVTLVLPVAPGCPELDAAGLACVTVEDKRVESLVSSILQTMGFEVVRGRPRPHVSPDVWITGGGATPELEAREYLRADRHGGLIVLGDRAEEWRSLGAIPLRAAPAPSEIREAVQHALRLAPPRALRRA